MANQLTFKVVDEKVILPENTPGIDTSNVLASNVTTTYLATEDCYVAFYLYVEGASSHGDASLYIDGVQVLYRTGYSSNGARNVFFLKKGQQLTRGGSYLTNSFNVYGLKY